MKLEILYDDLCYLHGDNGNVDYLVQSLPEAEIIHTKFGGRPAFAEGGADFLYLGSVTENQQKRILAELRPYKNELAAAISGGMRGIFTGNASEIPGAEIIYPDGSREEGLGITGLRTKITYPGRTNSLFLGEALAYDDRPETVGFVSRFSESEYGEKDEPFIKVVKGVGINSESGYEGVRVNNFFMTGLIGPFLPYNPILTQRLLSPWVEKPAFYDTAIEAYLLRVEDLHRDDLVMA